MHVRKPACCARKPARAGRQLAICDGRSSGDTTRHGITSLPLLRVQPASAMRARRKSAQGDWIMRASILCVTAALIAGGCSHNKEEETTTEMLRQQPPAAEAETQGGSTAGTQGAPAEECPMAVTGTTLRTEDTSGGVALVFLTSGDVSELRQRVRHMADMHNRAQGGQQMNMQQQGARKGPPTNSMPGSGMYDTQGSGAPSGGSVESDKTSGGGSMAMQPGMQGTHGMMPSSTARAEDVDGGAQLILIATDPSQTDALRQSAREEAQDMAAGNCSMMMGGSGMQQNQGMQHEQMQQQEQMQQPSAPAPGGMPGMENDSNEGGY
jgi:hypothetical protein